MARQIASAAVIGKWKRGRPRKRRRDEIEDDLNVIGINKRDRQWSETVVSGGRSERRAPCMSTECST
jgi:hypothetical protein